MNFKIKSLRKEFGLTQQDLANTVGVTQQSIHKYEKAYVQPDIKTLMTLANIFDTSIDYLVGFTDIRQKFEPNNAFNITSNEKSFIQKLRLLSDEKREIIVNLIDSL